MPSLRFVELRPGLPKLAKSARPSGWLLVLCFLLSVWEPLNLALSASSGISAISFSQPGRITFLLLRIVVAGIGVAAGTAIWNGRPHAQALAKMALGLSAAGAVIRFAWFPGNVPPGLRLPLALLYVAFNAAWYGYLTRLKA